MNSYQSFLGSPVLFENELSTKGVDNTGNGWSLPSTDEIKIQHALDSFGLQSVDESTRILIEEFVLESRELRSRSRLCGRGRESFNAIIGRPRERTFSSNAVGRCTIGNISVDAWRRWSHDRNLVKLVDLR